MTPLIYFDHAATSWPKPPQVKRAMDTYFDEAGGNPGRAGHRMSIAAARVVERSRDLVAGLFDVEDPGRIAFTKNATEALNIAIYGSLRPGDHAVTSSIEHNSVMRPLRDLEQAGVELTVVECSPEGLLDPTDVAAALRPETRLIVTLHGSNVMGSLLPIDDIAALARDRGIPYLVDVTQTPGSIPISAKGIDMIAFTGHKGLQGPTGTGGLIVSPEVSPRPLLRGGTGSKSDLEIQPDFMPDVYESGTLNVLGLAGLGGGLEYIHELGVESIGAHERELVERFLRGAAEVPRVAVHGPKSIEDRCGVLSFNVEGLTPSEVGMMLDRDFGIMSRVGLHCAPGAHRTMGTFPTGSVRFGFGASNTAAEVDAALAALDEMSRWAPEDDRA